MLRTSIACAILLASTVLGSACAKNPTTSASIATEASPGHPMSPGMMPMMGTGGSSCPMGVPGTAVQATETSDGMSMAFTTTGDVGELRKRAHAMADRMGGQPAGAMGMSGMMMRGGDGGAPGMIGPGMGGPGMMGGMGSGAHGMGGMSGMTTSTADGGSGMMMGPMPSMNVQVDDIEGGARLRMTPREPSRLAEMKQHLQQHVQMMNQGHGCSIMEATN